MNAKEFFENIRRIDRRIQNLQLLHEHYMDMACRATSRAEATRLSGTSQRSRVADYGVKLVDLERELQQEIEQLYETRRIASAAMNSLSDQRLRDVVELRYFRGYPWDKIARPMGYERRYVWRLNARALQALQERLPLGA